MKRVNILFLIFFFSTTVVLGQDYAFKVMMNKGSNQFKSQSADWQPVKTGQTFQNGDEIRILENCYMGLAHFSGRTIELVEPGMYEISKLATEMGSSRGVAARYIEFLFSKIEEDKGDHLYGTGAITRAGKEELSIMLPSTGKVLNNELTLKWVPEEEEGSTYLVLVKNMFDEPVLELETSEEKINLDLDQEKLKDQNLIFVKVRLKLDKSISSPDYGIERVKGDESKRYQNILEDLMKEINPDSPLSYLILGAFFEQEGLLIDAHANFLKAKEMAPDIEEFDLQYRYFLARNAIN